MTIGETISGLGLSNPLAGLGSAMMLFTQLIMYGMIAVVLFLIIKYMLRYNIKVLIHKSVHGTMFIEEDKAYLHDNKKKGTTSFKLQKRKVDLGNIITSTTQMIPVKKKLFGYGLVVHLLQTGQDNEIDSYHHIRPADLQKHIENQDVLSKNKISTTAKQSWMLNKKSIESQFTEVPWWQNPVTPLIINGLGIGAIVVTLIIASTIIQDILAQASSANVLTKDTLNAMIEALNNMRGVCVANQGGLPPP